MLIDDPTFYYWLVFGSLINYISGTIVFVPIYFKLIQENYKRNLRIVAFRMVWCEYAIRYLWTFNIIKYFYHQFVPLYILLWITLSAMVFPVLGFMCAGIAPDFFNIPHKVETKRAVTGMMISAMGIVLAVTIFL